MTQTKSRTSEVLAALTLELPNGIARTILDTTLRGEGIADGEVSDDKLGDVVTGLERKLLMFIVDPPKRKRVIERLREVERRAARERPTEAPPSES